MPARNFIFITPNRLIKPPVKKQGLSSFLKPTMTPEESKISPSISWQSPQLMAAGPKDIMPPARYREFLQDYMPEVDIRAGMKPFEYAFLPFTGAGMATYETEKELERLGGAPTGRVTPLMPKPKPVEKLNVSSFLPGGEKYEEYYALPFTEQLRYEAPFWALSMMLPGPVGTAKLTLQGVEKTAKKTFETVLNRGLDRILVQQGVKLPANRNKIINAFLRTHDNWLEKKVIQNYAARRAAKFKNPATKAAEDTVKEAETMLLAQSTPGGTAVPGQTKSLQEIMGGIEGRLGAPAEIRKTLPTIKQTNLLQTVQAQAKKKGLDVEAVQGISPDEYWVGITLPRLSGSPEFTEWLTAIRNTNPEDANKIEKLLVGKFDFKATTAYEPYGRKRFIPFKNIEDAKRFVDSGDVTAIASKIELKGQPMRPTQPTLAKPTVKTTPAEITPQPTAPIEQPTVAPLPEAPQAISEVVTPEIGVVPPIQAVNTIQEQGKVAPKSVKPTEAKYAHTEKVAPDGPRPPKPPKPVEAAKPERNPDDIIKEIADKTALGERPDQAIMRLHEAARNNIIRRTNIVIQKGDQQLKEQGIGVVKRGQLVPKEEDKPKLLELYNALHNPSKVASGEIAIPAGFETIYTELRGLADWDTASRLDFDPNAATLEDWFFRGWKPPEGMLAGAPARGALVTEPKALRTPRVNATFEEMVDLGFEPLFWNPYQQWGYRHNLGEVYREQVELVSYLKSMGDELIRPDAGGPLPVGWKIPRIGPAFEGKPFATTDPEGNPAVMFTRRWAVPDKVANSLESIYGKRPDMGKFILGGKTIDPLSIIDFVTFVPKRAKLFLSFFQQMDFLNRAGGGSWAGAIDNLLAGKPIDAVMAVARYPKTVADIVVSNFSPGKRLSISEQMDDTTPLIQGRSGINLKGISEAGLSTMDFTIFAKDMDKLMRTVAKESGIWGKAKGVGSSLVDLESAMRRGLFGGVYPTAMITDIKNNIALMMARSHPSATDNQLNAMIAKESNKKYSTITPSQSIIQNTFLREVLRRIAFSAGESEALLRQAAGMLHGPHKRFWAKQNLGIILFVLAVANVIHWASTGEPLPKERYVPIAKDNWGPLPFGYNTKFGAPTLPFEGRGGSEMTLDLMGQMDTAYRVLNPAFFVSARTSVPVRALMNQVSGTDFYGAPIDDVGPGGVWSRATQLGLDMFSPIGVGGIATETLRQQIPGAETVIPEGESRLGMLGLGLQATGINLRAEGTREILDRKAKESNFFKADGTPIQSWNELEPYQRRELEQDKSLRAELVLRQETSVERDYPGAAGYASKEVLDQQRIDRGEALVTEFEAGELEAGEFPKEVTRLKTEIASKRSQVDADFQLYQDTQELPQDPNKRALVEYYSIYDKAKRESESIDWEKVDQWETAYRIYWTPEQEAYVDRNVGITEWGPKMQEYIDAQKVLSGSGYWDLEEPNQYEKRQALRLQNPEVEAILVKWYGYKPAQAQYYSPPNRTDPFGRSRQSYSTQRDSKPVFK